MHHRRAFTLVELLVVVAIIAVLIALLLPALNKARQVARATVCMSQQRQLGLTFNLYSADYEGVFPGAESYDPGNRWLTWFQFYNGDYGTKYLSLPAAGWRCTQNTSAYYGLYFRRNIWWNGSPDLDTNYMISVAWGTHNFLGFNSRRFPRPAEFVLLADTSANITSQATITKGAFKFANVIETSPDPVMGVWLAHLNNTNMTFADGHSQAMNAAALPTVDNARQKNSNTGGIRFWKLEDGTQVTYP